MKKSIIVLIVVLTAFQAKAQEILTIERALDVAMVNSPEIRKSQNALRRSQENLNATKASQKSRISLRTDPLSYSLQNPYDREELTYYDREYLSSGFGLNVNQPIILTGGELSFKNDFMYSFDQNNKKRYDQRTGDRIFDDDGDEWFDVTTFLNDTRLTFTQPLFTYNVIKMELEELKLDYENSEISFALTKLNVEKNVRRLFYDVYNRQKRLMIAKE